MSESIYTKKATCGGARRGEIITAHGTFQTPAFMPVGTAGAVKALTAEDLESCGAEIILGNTYHLYLRPGTEIIKSQGGLAKFNGWNKPTLTDSGGYQVFSLKETSKITDEGVEFLSHHDGSRHMFTPERVMEIQHAIGADIIMAFDQCVPYPADRQLAAEGVRRTHEWAKICRDTHERLLLEEDQKRQQSGRSSGRPLDEMCSQADSMISCRVEPLSGSAAFGRSAKGSCPTRLSADQENRLRLFGIVQGSTYEDLRSQSAEQIVELDLPGNAIGGLSVGESMEEMEAILAHTIQYLPSDKPRYLMGVGYPENILMAVSHGIDMFDCVLPTRNARTGNVFTSEGPIVYRNAEYANDERPLDPNCDCRVCRRYSRAYIRHLYNQSEITGMVLATYHSTYFFQNLMQNIRTAIEQGRFDEFRKEFLETYRQSV